MRISESPIQKIPDITFICNNAAANAGRSLTKENSYYTELAEAIKDRFLNSPIEFKKLIYQDIIDNGLPSEHFGDTVSITFRQEQLTFSFDQLKIFELCRFAPDPDDAAVHPGKVHALNLSKYPMLIPDVNGKLFSASHAAASMLLKEYFGSYRKYTEAQNLLFQFIEKASLSSSEDYLVFWKTVYGNTNLVADISHVKL